MSIKLREIVGKPWFEAIILCVEDLGVTDFTLTDIYNYEDILSEAYPQNNNVRPKIRQQLQFLCKANIIERKEQDGQYKLIATELISNNGNDFSTFNVSAVQPPIPKNKASEKHR